VLDSVLRAVFPAAEAAMISAAVLDDASQSRDSVLRKDSMYKSQRVGGVPFFVVAAGHGRGPVSFSGAQPASVMEEVFSELLDVETETDNK